MRYGTYFGDGGNGNGGDVDSGNVMVVAVLTAVISHSETYT